MRSKSTVASFVSLIITGSPEGKDGIRVTRSYWIVKAALQSSKENYFM